MKLGSSGITLVLGGIAVRGLASIGVLQAINEHAIEIKRIVAAGLSSFAGAQFSLGRDFKSLIDSVTPFFINHQRELWTTERFSGIVRSDRGRIRESFSYFLRERLFCRANITRISLLSWDLVEDKLEEQFGDTGESELKIPLAISAIDLKRGEEVLLEEGDLISRLKAAIAFPGLFPPVRIGSKELVSSTLYCELPLGKLTEEDRPIIVVDLPDTIVGRRPKSVIDSIAQIDELRSTVFKSKLLSKADRIFRLDSLKGFQWGNYELIPELVNQAYQDMSTLLSCSQ